MKSITIKTLVLLMAVLLLEGCRRKKPETSAPAPDALAAANPEDPASAPLTPAPVVSYQVDAGLQRVLVKFFHDHQRPAMTWEDLVGGKYIPAVPLGSDGKPLDWNTTMQRIGKSGASPR